MIKSIKPIVSLFTTICILAMVVISTGVSAATALASTKLTKVEYNAKKESVKITWKKVKKAKGYELQLSTAKKFKKKATKTYTIKKNKTVTKTVKNLTVGKKYFVRIRAYKVAKVKGKKKTVYSKYSPVKNFKATEQTFSYIPAQGLNDKTVGVSSFVSNLTGYNYTLKFFDDFDGTTLNNQNWRISNANAGAGEDQVNVDENVTVGNGNLTLYARKTDTIRTTTVNKKQTYYTGAKIDSHNLQTLKYGRIEMYAKLPPAEYSPWPAFWTLGYGQWPMVGEIDIIEMHGTDFSYGAAVHFAEEGIEEAWNHDQSDAIGVAFIDPKDMWNKAYHVIGVEWTPTHMYGYVDGVKFGELELKGDMLTAFRNYEHYMILNYALGGMGGSKLGPNGWFDKMDVDWVKIWQTDAVEESVFYPGIQKDILANMGGNNK